MISKRFLVLLCLTTTPICALIGRSRFGDGLLSDDVKADSFTSFVQATERSLPQALTAAVGPGAGRGATAEALAYGWEHWDRVGKLDNPAGYLYRVGRNLAKRMGGLEARLAPVAEQAEVWVEPGLPLALGRLSEK